MNKVIWQLSAAIVTIVALAMPVLAQSSPGTQTLFRGAPELDPSLLVGGLAFVGASVMLVIERYRRSKK